MSEGFILTGETQTRVFDFVRIKHAIKLELVGLKNSQGSALQAAKLKGYVPASLVARGNINKRRETAVAYMEYVTTLLTSGGIAKQYGEEIVTGALAYNGSDDCGCPNYSGTERSALIHAPDVAVMCIGNHEKGNE